MFFHSVEHEVLFLAAKLFRYAQLIVSLWNMGVKMTKNDKFQYFDTPPTFEAQQKTKCVLQACCRLHLEQYLKEQFTERH